MAKYTNFYKIVQPTSATATVHDNQLLDPGYASSTNFSWYHKIIQGSASRQSRYNEYNSMDSDVEIARALDIIAEEMTGLNIKTNLPLDIVIRNEDQNVDDRIVSTLKAALTHWCTIHEFDNNRLFKVARNTIKYGDCFFRKRSPIKKWEWVPAGHVTGAVVEADDVTKIVGYVVKVHAKASSNNVNSTFRTIDDNRDTEIIPASEMVVFSINDDMSDSAPFGESVLRTIYKTHKQKVLLEDASVIYRIQRAPERRVFYLDTGNMNAARQKTFIETFKNELRQKNIPSSNLKGNASIDAIYNPNSMLEDIFIAQRCIALDTMINITNIGILPLHQVIKNHIDGIKQFALTINQDTGAIKSVELQWAGITKRDVVVRKIVLSNKQYLECTLDHKLIRNDLVEVLAQDVLVGDILKGYKEDLTVMDIIDVDDLHTTGCLTICTADNNHNFLIDAGIFIRNSDGVGSKVDVLPSGQAFSDLSDLEYFSDKEMRGLRVPLSWMKPGQNNAMFNDGKLGASYVEEQQFAKFVERLQVYVDSVIDKEFKEFLYNCNINIDHTLFKLKLPKPSNYKKYQQAEIDSMLLGMFGSADGVSYLSKRWILKNYLQLTEEQIIENERLRRQEMGLDNNPDKTLQQIYGTQGEEGMGGLGGMGGGMGGLGGEPMGGPSPGAEGGLGDLGAEPMGGPTPDAGAPVGMGAGPAPMGPA
jgi:hypothetical protein